MTHVVLGFRTGTTSYEECLELRDAFEPLIDGHAAHHHCAREIRELRRIVKTMHASVDDPAAFFKYNWALHRGPPADLGAARGGSAHAEEETRVARAGLERRSHGWRF